MNDAVIKQFTGGAKLAVRKMREEYRELRTMFKIIIDTNYERYCISSDISPMSMKMFSMEFAKYGFQKKKKHQGAFWTDIKLTNLPTATVDVYE